MAKPLEVCLVGLQVRWHGVSGSQGVTMLVSQVAGDLYLVLPKLAGWGVVGEEGLTKEKWLLPVLV